MHCYVAGAASAAVVPASEFRAAGTGTRTRNLNLIY